jgi:hypothetical protein
MVAAILILGREGRASLGVTGTAYERPLEGVADGSTVSPTFIQPLAWRNRSEGKAFPCILKKDCIAAVL